MDRDLLALGRLFAVARDDVFDAELEGDVPFRLVDLRSREAHGGTILGLP
jgi:hypothetical protein